MFHICFAANEPYIKYNAVLITSIIKSTNTSKRFKDFFEFNLIREREREQPNLNSNLNSANTKDLYNSTLDLSDSNTTNSIISIPLYPHNTNKSNIALCKSGGLK